MFALFRDGQQASKAHLTRLAALIEAYERGLIVRGRRLAWLSRPYSIEPVSCREERA